ncbi:beta-N-acetylhexosaminidase [Rubritalea tangerina]|uniref:beta-N-acetylhexosaminidase n=1 Tax=Rubritalea tangerina TaxID=430798 RepID=A0ABW4ZEZ6_9BACT
MKLPNSTTIRGLAGLGLALAASASPLLAGAEDIIPLPQKLEVAQGNGFSLTPATTITYKDNQSKAAAELLAAALRPATGFPFQVKAADKAGKNTIHLDLSNKIEGIDGYALKVDDSSAHLRAATPGGLVSGVQTIRQLLPEAIFASAKQTTDWTLEPVTITDYAEYPWRGVMLDVSRYFLNKDYVLRYLDMMAMHKLNVFHWHLIDDCGWRIEIKKYPKLTEIGSKRGSGRFFHEGFYTQEDIKEVVAYAAKLNIEVVPEIEIPAHILSALCAYPHLGCTGKQFTVPDRHSISPEIYCAGKESTYEFLEDVMDEVVSLFPSKWVHIGGDEAKYARWKACPDCQARMKEHGLKSEKQLQGYMTDRIGKYLAKKDKVIIGWAEVLECGVDKKTGIMAWHKPSHASEGAKEGHPVVSSLVRHTYFDTPESKLPGEPPCATWTPPVSLKMAYDWHPTPKDVLGSPAAKNILGPNGAVWTDRFLHNRDVLHDKPGEGSTASEAYVDYLSLPRFAALAEVGWTAQDKRDYASFLQRMKPQYIRYQLANYNFRMPTPTLDIKRQSNGELVVKGESPIKGGTIRYTLDDSEPTANSKELTATLTAPEDAIFKAKTFAANGDASLTYTHIDATNKWRKFGTKIGEWKSGKVGNKKTMEVVFDATGHINQNGTYLITFIYTGGRERLDIDGIEVVRNDTDHVGKDIHHGFTGGSSKNNTYKIKVNNYETGASFKIKAQIYGDQGNDSNGVVLIKRQ